MDKVDGTISGRSTVHGLKTDPEYFDAVWTGIKTFEYRLNDRNYKVGDVLMLRETRHSSHEMRALNYPLEYTGRMIVTTVTYILTLDNAYAILGFNKTYNTSGGLE